MQGAPPKKRKREEEEVPYEEEVPMITLLCRAIQENETLLVEQMLARFPHLVGLLDGEGYSALGTAVLYERTECVDALIKAGADVNKRTAPIRGATTPLVEACERNKIDIVRLLLEAGADPNITPDEEGETETPLSVVLESDGSLEVFKLLCQYGAKLDGPPQQMPLDAAVLNSRPDILEFLIWEGANRALPTFNEITAAQFLLNKTNRTDVDNRMLKMLMRRGKKIP